MHKQKDCIVQKQRRVLGWGIQPLTVYLTDKFRARGESLPLAVYPDNWAPTENPKSSSHTEGSDSAGVTLKTQDRNGASREEGALVGWEKMRKD